MYRLHSNHLGQKKLWQNQTWRKVLELHNEWGGGGQYSHKEMV